MKIYQNKIIWEIRRAVYNFSYWLWRSGIRQPAYGTWGWAIQSGKVGKEKHPGFVR